MGLYSRARLGIKDAGMDLIDLAKGIEGSYRNRDFQQTKEALNRYIGTEHAGKVLATAPLIGAGVVAGVEPVELALNGVVAGVTAPFAGGLFYKKDMKEARAEEASIQRKIAELDGLLESTPSADNINSQAVSTRTRTATPEELNDWFKQRQYLNDVSLPNARHRQVPIRGRQMAVGAGLTGAGLALLSVLRARGNQEQAPEPSLSQTVHQYPSAPPQQTAGTLGLTNLNADFSNAPTLMVPPVNNELLGYWGSGLA